jgi:hypothetical protein
MSATGFQRRRRELAKKQAAARTRKATAAPPQPPKDPPTASDLPESMGDELRELLVANGFGTLERVRLAADSQLLEIKGIGPKSLQVIRSETE